MGYKVKKPDEFLISVRKAGFNQTMLADYLGIAPSYLSAITHQRRCAGKSLANFISKTLNLDLNDIFLDISVEEMETDKRIGNEKSVVENTTIKES